jgi:hypothetical protein
VVQPAVGQGDFGLSDPQELHDRLKPPRVILRWRSLSQVGERMGGFGDFAIWRFGDFAM